MNLDDAFRPDEPVTVSMFAEGVIAWRARRWWQRLLRLGGHEIEVDLEEAGLVLIVIRSEEDGRTIHMLREESPETVRETFDELERIDRQAANAVWN